MGDPRDEGEQAYRQSDTPVDKYEAFDPYQQGLEREDLRSQQAERGVSRGRQPRFGLRRTSR